MATKEYLVRADLTVGLVSVPTSTKLPICIGPFKLDHSPNAEFYVHDEIGELDELPPHQSQPDSRFPMSQLYVERKIQVCDKDSPNACADEDLELLERLLRLFQPGEVSVQRHRVWNVHEDSLRPAWSWSAYNFEPVKPPASGLHDCPPYSLDDDALDRLIAFVDVRWDVLNKIPRHLKIAMARFNSSYERRGLTDRLIDLVVALEALFGDGESGSIAYKVAIRCACWLHTPGKERCAAFDTVKKLYRARSDVVHGGWRKDLNGQSVAQLEGMVRESLLKFLDHQVRKGNTPQGREIDDLIMTGKM